MHHSYRKFINVFSETFNSSFPVRPGSPPQKRNHKPWMSNGLVNACTKKNLLYKRFLTSRSSTSEIRYETYKNKLNVFDLISVLFAYVILGQKNRPN